MAKGGNAYLDIEYNKFYQSLDVFMDRVERGTKKATTAACIEILDLALQKVPRETGTLAKSGYYRVDGRIRNFTGVVGFGGNGNPINPKTGEPASKYMIAVHEDLTARHPIGEAKFLENAVREYQSQFGPRAVNILRMETN